MSADENAALARKIYDLWNDRDIDTALDLGTEDVEIRLMAYGNTVAGRDGFRQFMERFATAFPDMKKEVTNQVASEDQVVSEFTLRGTHDGPLKTPTGEIPPTGKAVEYELGCTGRASTSVPLDRSRSAATTTPRDGRPGGRPGTCAAQLSGHRRRSATSRRARR